MPVFERDMLMSVGRKYDCSIGACDRCGERGEYTLTIHGDDGDNEVPVCRSHAKAILPELQL